MESTRRPLSTATSSARHTTPVPRALRRAKAGRKTQAAARTTCEVRQHRSISAAAPAAGSSPVPEPRATIATASQCGSHRTRVRTEHTTPAMVSAATKDDPPQPPLQNVANRRCDGERPCSLSVPLPALQEQDRHFLEGCTAPPCLEQTFRISECAFRLERHRLNQRARVDRDVLIILQRQTEQQSNQAVIDDRHKALVRGVGTPVDHSPRRNRSFTNALEHVDRLELIERLREVANVVRP